MHIVTHALAPRGVRSPVVTRPGFPADLPAIDRHVKKLKIEVTHRATTQTFIAKGLTNKPANREMFTKVDEKTGKETEMSVAAYFEEAYKYKLKYPSFPCVIVGQSQQKLPLEVCRIARAQVHRDVKLHCTCDILQSRPFPHTTNAFAFLMSLVSHSVVFHSATTAK